MSVSSTNSFLPDTPINANSLSPGSRRRMMYDVPLVPAGFAAFQRSVRFPPLASSVADSCIINTMSP